jgi:hypothetical protein
MMSLVPRYRWMRGSSKVMDAGYWAIQTFMNVLLS